MSTHNETLQRASSQCKQESSNTPKIEPHLTQHKQVEVHYPFPLSGGMKMDM
jgi:hypothetical protein|uniref:Uncharacterized protein n=1 Tax=Populus trichocarpa TaxID=3694 RepID=A0A3N7FLK8_POPTR